MGNHERIYEKNFIILPAGCRWALVESTDLGMIGTTDYPETPIYSWISAPNIIGRNQIIKLQKDSQLVLAAVRPIGDPQWGIVEEYGYLDGYQF